MPLIRPIFFLTKSLAKDRKALNRIAIRFQKHLTQESLLLLTYNRKAFCKQDRDPLQSFGKLRKVVQSCVGGKPWSWAKRPGQELRPWRRCPSQTRQWHSWAVLRVFKRFLSFFKGFLRGSYPLLKIFKGFLSFLKAFSGVPILFWRLFKGFYSMWGFPICS